jgi:DnaJ-class molecular chaperone
MSHECDPGSDVCLECKGLGRIPHEIFPGKFRNLLCPLCDGSGKIAQAVERALTGESDSAKELNRRELEKIKHRPFGDY